jgi:tight adherence protein C
MPMPVVFGALAVLFIAIGLAAIPMLRDAGPVERLGGRIGGVREAVERTSVTAKLVEALAARLGPRLAPSLQGSRRAALEHKLDYAGRPGGLTVQRFVGRKAALALLLGVGGGGFMILLGAAPIWMPLLAVAGWFAPNVLLNRAGRLRQEAIERSLPDFLDILAVSVRAGLGYRYALRRVAESLGGPVGEEMFIVLRQIDLGADRREAFLALRERNESDALKSFVAAQLQAEELGVPLSEALNDIAADMRRMASQNARRQAQRASPRVSLLVTTLIVPGSMILILLSIYFSVAGTTGGGVSLFGG